MGDIRKENDEQVIQEVSLQSASGAMPSVIQML